MKKQFTRLLLIFICLGLACCTSEVPTKGNKNPLKELTNQINSKYLCHSEIEIYDIITKLDNHLIKIKIDSIKLKENQKKIASEVISMISTEVKKHPFHNENLEYNLKLNSDSTNLNLNINELILSKIEDYRKECDTILTSLTTNNSVNWEALIDKKIIQATNHQIDKIINETEQRNGEISKYNYSHFEFFEAVDSLVLMNYNIDYYKDISKTNKNQIARFIFNLNTSKIVGLEI